MASSGVSRFSGDMAGTRSAGSQRADGMAQWIHLPGESWAESFSVAMIGGGRGEDARLRTHDQSLRE